MPQESIYYAIGRLSVMQKNTLDASKLERLLQAPTAQEARRTLSEMGWSAEGDYDRIAAQHVENACRLIREIATDEEEIDCFLLKYDVNNLKMLLKARSLGREAEDLSPCGVYPVEKLRKCVADRKYDGLPQTLKDALDELEKQLSLRVDPLEIDARLDRAMYETIFARLPKKNSAVRKYFTARVDILNLVIALRVLHMGKNASFFVSLLLPGGSIVKKEWLKGFEKPEKLPLLLNKYGQKVYNAAIAAQMDAGKIAALERAMDDCLLAVYLPYKSTMDSPQRLIGYLLMRQREAAAVRLILAGKTAGFAAEKIRERLRDLYA